MKKIIKHLFSLFGFEVKRIHKSAKVKSSGDLKKIFSYVYEDNVWGGDKGEFFSGPGSDELVTKGYVELVNKFINENSIKSIVDLGCGDYRVGSLIQKIGLNYVGIDIVPALIEHNLKKYKSDNIDFLCLNAVDDILPKADLCLVRQVLQHLSNKNIETILEKCKIFKYVIISEHLPSNKNAIPNLDMSSNWDIRLIQNSGVYIDKPPFSQTAITLLEIDPSHDGYSDSIIRTSLIKN